MLDKPLNDRERRFVEEYLLDLDPRRAALTAGYSASTAATKAYQWVSKSDQKPHVFAAIEVAKTVRSQRTLVNADSVLTRLDDILNANIADIINDDNSYKPIHEWPLIWRKMLSGMDVQELYEGTGKDRKQIGAVVKVRFADYLKTLELVGKHVDVQAYLDKKELTGGLTLTHEEALAQLEGDEPVPVK